MKTTIPRLGGVSACALLALLAAPGIAAQGKSQDQLEQLYQEKIQEPWFKNGGWTDDFGAAKARAQKEGKPVLAYFTRSYSP